MTRNRQKPYVNTSLDFLGQGWNIICVSVVLFVGSSFVIEFIIALVLMDLQIAGSSSLDVPMNIKARIYQKT